MNFDDKSINRQLSMSEHYEYFWLIWHTNIFGWKQQIVLEIIFKWKNASKNTELDDWKSL